MVTGREVEVPASVLLACTVFTNVPVVMMEAGWRVEWPASWGLALAWT
jgi:hypothetical protein